MIAKHETQFESAQRMYSARAADYENSWHPQFSRRFMDIAAAQSGDRVLILACGTGLEIAIAAPLVGDDGLVFGIDATAAMLAEAEKKVSTDPVLSKRVKLIQHDVTNLSSLSDIEANSFDLIVCTSAFVLFEKPGQVVAHWREYLKVGGRMVIDIAHEHNLRSGLLMEHVAKGLRVPYASNRSWVKSESSFREILQSNGLVVERIELLEKELGKGTTYLDVEQADEQFDSIMSNSLTRPIATDEFKTQARPLFKKAWEAAAVDGKVEVSDVVYVYVARKI